MAERLYQLSIFKIRAESLIGVAGKDRAIYIAALPVQSTYISTVSLDGMNKLASLMVKRLNPDMKMADVKRTMKEGR